MRMWIGSMQMQLPGRMHRSCCVYNQGKKHKLEKSHLSAYESEGHNAL